MICVQPYQAYSFDLSLAWICTNALLGNDLGSGWCGYAGHHTMLDGSELAIHLIKKHLETCSVSIFHWLRSCRFCARYRLNWFHMTPHVCWEQRNCCRNIAPYGQKHTSPQAGFAQRPNESAIKTLHNSETCLGASQVPPWLAWGVTLRWSTAWWEIST